ncbi:hypothetical protein DFA_09764 [Cavenderia fasciculata]|uniref:Uncharacterized protein n=1 Tax=Cavenderia fasciculata TaxID=261658 RepID=F4Q8J2_CACFS|nr:uncharacterized protein DFA_09764 [Cavenderia fasciculata]EGG16092.1 hypothetical protein DFA_09764 [Cavenderia fasciculata]|eukprot:XP_004352417.1 hypothetical protein DFA_09764 [Cavenderia fasciculata]
MNHNKRPFGGGFNRNSQGGLQVDKFLRQNSPSTRYIPVKKNLLNAQDSRVRSKYENKKMITDQFKNNQNNKNDIEDDPMSRFALGAAKTNTDEFDSRRNRKKNNNKKPKQPIIEPKNENDNQDDETNQDNQVDDQTTTATTTTTTSTTTTTNTTIKPRQKSVKTRIEEAHKEFIKEKTEREQKRTEFEKKKVEIKQNIQKKKRDSGKFLQKTKRGQPNVE